MEPVELRANRNFGHAVVARNNKNGIVKRRQFFELAKEIPECIIKIKNG